MTLISFQYTKKLIIPLLMMFVSINVLSQVGDIYHLKSDDISGEVFDFKNLKGKKVIIVNTASKCMYTPQYKALQKLYEKYNKTGLEILAFPCNDFFNREPGTNKEISEFCSNKYNITFKVMSKIHCKGDKIHPVYKYLTTKDENGQADSEVKWNFQKYLIDEDGEISYIIPPGTKPDAKVVINWLENK